VLHKPSANKLILKCQPNEDRQRTEQRQLWLRGFDSVIIRFDCTTVHWPFSKTVAILHNSFFSVMELPNRVIFPTRATR
jgi:hypothetical protein